MADEQSFEVEWREVGDIMPYEKNPRKFGDDVIDAVASSIKSFGWRQPIVVDVDGVIVAGHARYAAALKMGLKTVPVHVFDGDEKAIRAYRVADNKSGDLADWDINKLMGELRELGELDFDMTDFGFSQMEIEMATIDDLGVMTGEREEPWGGDPNSFVSEKQEDPRCIVYFGTEEAKEKFLAWVDTQDASIRRQQSKNECHVAYMPAREQRKYKDEADTRAAEA